MDKEKEIEDLNTQYKALRKREDFLGHEQKEIVEKLNSLLQKINKLYDDFKNQNQKTF